tara:strand:- start:13218 stop:13697 length:480 start_codon:yes stop_codon:yes gene_type:complete
MNNECYQRALRLLTQREYSRPKLVNKLSQVGFDREDATLVCQHLFEKGFLKEQWYIESKIKHFMRKGHAPKSIQSRLAAEELNVEICIIEDVFKEYGSSKEDQLEHLLEKKAASIRNSWHEYDSDQRYKVKMKLARSLVAKGFSPNEGLRAVEAYLNNI